MPYLTSRLLLLTLITSLAACFGGGHYAPVIERKASALKLAETYTVSPKDTLYSIAWRYGLDFRRLASTNGLAAPFIIYPGQILQLKATPQSTKARAPKQPSLVKSGAANVAVESRRKPTKTPKPAVTSNSVGALSLDKKTYPFRWQRPAKGKTVRSYSSGSAVHKGVDLKGKLGESVYAANSGKVVYAGSGLVGYGKLLIIKHDEHYLSAYGHNSKLLVKEGELVKVGQEIAEFGDSGTDSVKLHFEIRRDGKPVNPLNLLPRG